MAQVQVEFQSAFIFSALISAFSAPALAQLADHSEPDNRKIVWFSDSMDPSIQVDDKEWITAQVIAPAEKRASVEEKNLIEISIPDTQYKLGSDDAAANGTPFCSIDFKNLAKILLTNESLGAQSKTLSSVHLQTGIAVPEQVGIRLNLFARDLSAALKLKHQDAPDHSNQSLQLARAHLKWLLLEMAK